MQTHWLSPTGYVTGDTTLQISYASVSHPCTIITCTSSGDLKWVSIDLPLHQNITIDQVTVCYELSNAQSFISQVRLVEMTTPNQAVVRHDDPTDLKSTSPTCYSSQVAGFAPAAAAVTLLLRLNFQDTSDEIRLGAVAVGFHGQGQAEHCIGSIAALKALSAGAVPCLTVLGYYTAGDGGGGAFYWDASCTEPDNAGTIFAPASDPPIGRWKRLVDGPLSVKWFGAVGEGLTDDTHAIQAAISVAVANGGDLVFLPAGTYVTSARLVILNAQGVTVRGAGRRATQIRAGNSFPQSASWLNPNLDFYGQGGVGGTVGSFHVKQVVQGQTSLATGTISAIYLNGLPSAGGAGFHSGTLTLTAVTGTFVDGEQIKEIADTGQAYADKTQYPCSPIDNPLIKLQGCYKCGVEDISLDGNSSLPHRPSCLIASLIDTADPARRGWGASRNSFRRVSLGGDQSNMAWYGIAYDYITDDENNDQGHFEEVDCANLIESGFWVRGTQSRQHCFYNCTCLGGRRTYQDAKNGLGGSMAWFGGGGYWNTTSNFEFHGNSAGGINSIIGFLGEQNARLLTHDSVAAVAACVTLRDVNWYGDKLAADREMIQLLDCGTIIIDGCHFGFGPNAAAANLPRIHVYNATNPAPDNIAPIERGNIILTNNSFDNSLAANFSSQVLGATTGPPIQITTSTEHNLSDGQTVLISGVTGNTNANGIWVITVVDAKNFTLSPSKQGNGNYNGGGLVTAGEDPLYITSDVPYTIVRHGNTGNNGGAQIDLPGEPPVQNDAYVAAAYGTSVPIYAFNSATPFVVSAAPSGGGCFEVSASNGAAFTIQNPNSTLGNPIAYPPTGTSPGATVAHQKGRRITIKVKNVSGGALGALTWDTKYKLAVWTQPANGFSRSITFVWDGTNWV
jgi:hypothetical protein